jgi:hypothetical protein
MKRENWKQKTPTDQLTATRASLAGMLDNYREGILSADGLYIFSLQITEEIEELEPFLRNPETWNQ